MISAEVAIGASIMGVVMVLRLARPPGHRARPGQRSCEALRPWIPAWGILTQPLAFFLFLTAGIAATKRIPFDMPEGESEIIGYFVEYSGMKFGMFADGGLPGDGGDRRDDAPRSSWAAGRCRTSGLRVRLSPAGRRIWRCRTSWWRASRSGRSSLKVVVMIWLLMLIRWTLPRFRYDQAMRLGWLGLFPLSILNIVVTSLVLLAVGR